MLIPFPDGLLSPKVAGSHSYNAELGQGHNHASTRLTSYNFFEQISMVLPDIYPSKSIYCATWNTLSSGPQFLPISNECFRLQQWFSKSSLRSAVILPQKLLEMRIFSFNLRLNESETLRLRGILIDKSARWTRLSLRDILDLIFIFYSSFGLLLTHF